jgi:cytochrome P450
VARDTSVHEGPLDAIDLTDLDRFSNGFPHPVFARLRRDAPVFRHPATEHTPDGEPFWVLSRHEDVLAAAGAPDVFSSDGSGQRPTGGGTLIEDLAAGFAAGVLLNMMDDPRHHRIRKLVTPALAPRTLALLEDDLRARTAAIVDGVAERGACDFLVDVAAELPLQAIARLLGVPQEDRHQLFRWANTSLDYDDRDLGESSAKQQEASAAMFAYGTALIEDKRGRPADDLLSRVATATIPRDGDDDAPLEELEVQMFFNLLIAAGSETTRNSIAHGLLAFLDHPDQWRALQADRSLLPTAVEEVLRYTSSTTYNRRTATTRADVGGQVIEAGEKVTLWWSSANHDDTVFEDPHRFDVTRAPNRHLAFGHGTHFCLGAALARIEIRVVFDALLDRFDRLEPAGPPEWTRSNKHTGLRHLPVAVVSR